MMTESPFTTDNYLGPYNKRQKLSAGGYSNNFVEEKPNEGLASVSLQGSKVSQQIATTGCVPSSDEANDSVSKQQLSSTISYVINSVDSEKLGSSSPSSMAALSTSSCSTDESGYQSGGNSSMTPQPSYTTNMAASSGISVPSSMNTFVSSGFSPSYVTGIGASPSNCHAALVHNTMTGCSSPMQSSVIANHNKQMFSNQTPSINATSGIYGNGTQAYTPQNPSLVFNINSNNSPSPTFIPMNNSTFQPGGSGGFSSPSNGSLQTPRDILTRQQLIFYFCHSSVCLVKNGNNAKGPMGASSNCKVPYCPESKHVLQHLQLCPNSRICGVSSCLGLRWARDHYSNCKNMSCVMCEPVRKNRAAFVCSVQSPQSTSDFRKSLKDWIMSEEPLTRNDNGAGRKNPRFELNKKARLSTIASMVSAIIPRGDSSNGGQGSLLASEEQTRKVIDLTRQVELDVYYDAADKDEYFEKMACRSYEFQKRMEDLQRTKNEELQQQQQTSLPMPPPTMQGGTGLNVGQAEVNIVSSSVGPSSVPAPSKVDDLSIGETSRMSVDSSKSILSSLLNKENSPAMLNNNNNCPPKTPTQTEEDMKPASVKLPPPPQPPVSQPTASSSGSAVSNSDSTSTVAEPVDTEASKMDTSNDTTHVKEEPCADEKSSKMETDVKTEATGECSTAENVSPKVKEEPEASTSEKAAEVTPPEVKKKEFTIDEIRQSLWPVLQHIIGQPESEPFRVPVDYMSLGLTDYPEVVKEPMDISTIRKNMFEDHYSEDPWKFIQHMQLMFSNAWLYNRKATKIYKNTTRLSEIFYEKIDDAMRSLGFCCGQHYTFSPIPIYCYQKLCHIPRDAKYFVWTNSAPKTGILSEKYIYCSKCFNETSSGLDNDEFPVSDEPGVAGAQILNVPKSAFEQVTNNNVESEKFVECVDCGRKWHVICAMHLQAISSEFHCPTCLKLQGISNGISLTQTQELAKFSANRLPTNKMAAFIERSVNKQLKIADCPHVSIRVLSCCNKIAEVQPKMQARFPDYPKQFPYRHKALFAFTQVDNRDVCIFGMTVQEYGSDCPQPNTRRVYLSYLDSVFFFEPRSMRTTLYHRILIAYFDYCKQLGYDYAHIWACPPGEGDDYIFHCHPLEQKTPKPKRLQDWYKSMLDQALQEGVIEDYKDIQKACEDSNPAGFTSATQLPYFEGDYWPKVLEDLITQVGDNNSSSSSKNVSASAASLGAANEEEIHSVESDPAMTPGAQDMEQQCATPNPSGNDEIASTPPSTNANNETGNGASNANNSNDKTQKQPRKKSKKWSGGSSSRHKQRKPATLDLTEKVMQNMTSCRDSFFTIRLQTYKTDSSGSADTDRSPDNRSLMRDSRKKIEEPDPDVHYELMEGRDSFLHMSREKYWEFSSLRRAKYSTMCMVYELHTATNSLIDKSSNAADSKADSNNSSSSTANSATSKAEMMSQWIKVLVHATTCRNANCNNPAQCPNFKQLLSHAKSCAQRNNQHKQTTGSTSKANAVGCITCTNLFKMFIKHAETCTKGTQPCTVPYCQDIRRRNSRQDLMLRRRMAMMMQRTNSVNGPPSQNPNSVGTTANSPLMAGGTNCSINHQPRTPYTPSPSSNEPSSQAVLGSTVSVSQQVPPPLPPPQQSHPIVSSSAPRTSTQSQAPYNPPPAGALEAAQRAKKQAAMQSSCGTIVTQPGGYTVPNLGPVTSVPYHPGTTIGLPAYQQSGVGGPSQSMGGAAVGLPDGVTGANPNLVYHGGPTGVPISDGSSPGAGSPMFLNGSPYAPQMIMVSSQQQMMRPGAPVYFPNAAGNNQHQMQMSQIPMTQQHLRSQLIRGPMPSMGMMGPGGAGPHHGRMIMHGQTAYSHPAAATGAYNPAAAQQWIPMGPGNGGGNPSQAAMAMSAGPPPQRIPVPVSSIRGAPVGSNTMMLINPNDPGGGVVNPGQFMNNPGQIPSHFVNGNINAPGGVAPSPGGGFMQTNKANNPNPVANNIVMNSDELQKYADSL